MKRWDTGAILGESLCKLWPEQNEFWFLTAYCQHEQKLTQEARDTLLEAPQSIRSTAVFHYNSACYAAQLGKLNEAKDFLKTCFEIQKDLREEALDDPDLAPVWDSTRAD